MSEDVHTNQLQGPRWIAADTASPQVIAALAETLHCSHALAALLAARGVDSAETARRFLDPALSDLHDPWLLKGMQAAVARIQQAVAASEAILIYGDYDVDGTTATVLLKTAIERTATAEAAARVSYHVPHRLREGYGMQNVRLAEAAAAGVTLVISVDTGIRAFAAAAEAKALGLDLIVTDHHLPDGVEGIPEALAVINPAQPGCLYPNKNLCGAAVAFKLAHALLAAHAETPAQELRLDQVLLPSFLKLVAIATIADSVSLTGENRAIAAIGLRELANPVQPGLRALMQVSALSLEAAPSATEVGFRLAPRINAAGRMDVASDVVELFLTRDPELANALAGKLDALNEDRRATEQAALLAIELQLESLRAGGGDYVPECLVLDHPEWHRGVLGILASRVVERTGRPALVLSHEEDQAHGSGRSVAGFHLLDALTSVHAAHHNKQNGEQLFTRFGGHAHAVGFSLPLSNLPHLRRHMQAHSAGILTGDLLQAEVVYELELSAGALTAELFAELKQCAPFGMGNAEPQFLLRGLTLEAAPRVIKERHVCLKLAETVASRPLSIMGWSRGSATSWAERCAALSLGPGSRVDLICRLRENLHPQYGGLELEAVDLRCSRDERQTQKQIPSE